MSNDNSERTAGSIVQELSETFRIMTQKINNYISPTFPEHVMLQSLIHDIQDMEELLVELDVLESKHGLDQYK